MCRRARRPGGTMAKHKRREGYWRYYGPARRAEQKHVRAMLVWLILKYPHPPKEKKSNRGRPPDHSKEKLDYACIWMMVSNSTYQEAEDYMEDNRKRLPWKNEPVPDSTKICRHMQTIDMEWMDMILAETARLCLTELADGVTAPLVTDSSAVETTRYEDVERPNKKKGGFENIRVKTYEKYHIIATEGHPQ